MASTLTSNPNSGQTLTYSAGAQWLGGTNTAIIGQALGTAGALTSIPGSLLSTFSSGVSQVYWSSATTATPWDPVQPPPPPEKKDTYGDRFKKWLEGHR